MDIFKKKDNSVLILVKSEDQYRRNNFCQAYNAHSNFFNTYMNVVIFVKRPANVQTVLGYLFLYLLQLSHKKRTRNVTDENKITLKHQLYKEFTLVNCQQLQSVETIECITDNCNRIFTTRNVMGYRTIWLLDTADQVITVFNDVFDVIMIH